MKEVPPTDIELVKCIETKFQNGEFEREHNSDLSFLYYHEPWVSDSIEITLEEEFRYVNGHHEYVDVAKVIFGNQALVLTEHESDRIVEIIDAYEEKQDSILQVKLDKEQKILRDKITKYCKIKL
jgi:hypothetical protein